MVGLPAFAQAKVKIGFIFLGPIGDYGWTWAHNKGRLAIEEALGDKVETVYVENVAEDASADPADPRPRATRAATLIFTTSYGYMDQTIQVASEFPNVKFEHCTGFKRADNVATYNSKFHEGRAVLGTISGMMSEVGHARLSRLLQGARGGARGELLCAVGAEARTPTPRSSWC